jgi:hypothetical protein
MPVSFCDPTKTWTITLKLDKDPPANAEDFIFRLTAGGIGQVDVPPNNKMSDLKWTCQDFGVSGQPNAKALMSFLFRCRRTLPAGPLLEYGVLLAGFAHVRDDGKVEFNGRLRTFSPDINTPAPGTAQMQFVTPSGDPGDTGTGNGTQT